MDDVAGMPGIRTLVISPHRPPFVEQDIRLLQSLGPTQCLEYGGLWSLGAYLLRLLRSMDEVDCVLVWFADIHAVFAAVASHMRSLPCLVVVGGYEVASLPLVRYGLARSATWRWIPRLASRFATKLLPVSAGLATEASMRLHVPAEKIIVLPTAFDSDFWTPRAHKEMLALTVVASSRPSTLYVKGVDRFISASKRLPHLNFAIVGVDGEAAEVARENAPSNLTLVQQLSKEELREWYRRAKVYCQLSRSEGLPNALAEAILCGCTPVGSRVSGVVELIANHGFITDGEDPTELARTIDTAMRAVPDPAAREYVQQRYSNWARLSGLHSVMDMVLAQAGRHSDA